MHFGYPIQNFSVYDKLHSEMIFVVVECVDFLYWWLITQWSDFLLYAEL